MSKSPRFVPGQLDMMAVDRGGLRLFTLRVCGYSSSVVAQVGSLSAVSSCPLRISKTRRCLGTQTPALVDSV